MLMDPLPSNPQIIPPTGCWWILCRPILKSFLQQDVDLFDIFLKPAPICQLPNLMEAKSCLTLLLT
jgi:hypothetical protein